MTSVLQPQVREFHRQASYSDEAYTTCIIPSVNGSPHGVDMTITQARALSVELSRAIYEYDLVEGVDRPTCTVAIPSGRHSPAPLKPGDGDPAPR
ncbi:MAG: hypothetical protein QOC86_3109 [Gaiellales bacterium]|nr:hypothetical protein [Gaiellales bacterium]